MPLQTFVVLYLISVPLFFALDMLWLGLIARSFYRERLSGLMGEINWGVAIAFYLIFLIGLTFFATLPAVKENSIMSALILGSLFGFFTYATYDLTNLATLRDWPVSVSIVDILWGTLISSAVSSIACLLFLRFM